MNYIGSKSYFRYNFRCIMKKVLLILVGGTICTSFTKHGTLSVDSSAGTRLVDSFMKSQSPYKDKVEIITSENLGVLSENMTVEKWNVIIKTFQKMFFADNYDGVVFAHGTDTLAYTASLFSVLLAGINVPVFLASSNARLGNPTANGNDNFRCAVECICRGIAPGIYVAYKNISDGKMYLHQDTRLQQCENYSDDFHSQGAIDITNVSDNNFNELNSKLLQLYPCNKRKSLVDTSKPIQLLKKVLYVVPYVGIDYSAYNYGAFSAVVHGSYHCGTACVQKTEDNSYYDTDSILYMLDCCEKENVDAYITPTRQAGEYYDTIRVMANHTGKINFIYGITAECAYTKLVIAYSLFSEKKDIEKFMNTEINFEFIK